MSATVVASYPFLTVTRTTATSSRSRCERSTISRGSPWRPRGSRQARRSSGSSRTVPGTAALASRQPRLPERLLVSPIGTDRQVDDLRQQLRQLVCLSGRNLVEEENLGLAEGESRV